MDLELQTIYLQDNGTSRLLIRKLNPSDAKAWQTFYENNPSLHFLGFEVSSDREVMAREWMEFQFARYQSNRFGLMGLVDRTSGNLIGQCGLLTQEVDGQKLLEIGYHILPQFWGKGYATEAAQYFRNYAFEKNLADSLVSIIDVRNVASQRVAAKNGMRRGKQIRYYDLDCYIYRIRREEWSCMQD